MKKCVFIPIVPILLQFIAVNEALARNDGTISCSSISRGDRRFSRNLLFRDATLSNAGEGFRLSFKIQGRSVNYNVTSDLVVQDTDYNSSGEINSKLTIRRNGSFSFTHMPRSQQICEIRGVLSFGQGVKQKIFGER
jgi:hypothetical protein